MLRSNPARGGGLLYSTRPTIEPVPSTVPAYNTQLPHRAGRHVQVWCTGTSPVSQLTLPSYHNGLAGMYRYGVPARPQSLSSLYIATTPGWPACTGLVFWPDQLAGMYTVQLWCNGTTGLVQIWCTGTTSWPTCTEGPTG